MAKEESTFQDILLELMVANETLGKIDVGIKSLQPLLQPAAVAPEAEKNDDATYACCEKILEQMHSVVAGLNYLSGYAEDSNRLLTQIRNNLIGMRDEAELERLRNLEREREASRGTGTTAASGVSGGKGVAFGSNLGLPTRILGTIAASLAAVPAALKAFLLTFLKEMKATFAPKNFQSLKKLFANIKDGITTTALRSRDMLKNFAAMTGEKYDRFLSRTRAYTRLVGEPMRAKFGAAVQKLAETPVARVARTVGKITQAGIKDIGADLGLDKAVASARRSVSSFATGLKDVGKIMAEGVKETKTGLIDGFGVIRRSLGEKTGGLVSELRSIGKYYRNSVKTFAATTISELKILKGELTSGFLRIVETVKNLVRLVKESALGRYITEVFGAIKNVGNAFKEIWVTFKAAGEGTSFFSKLIASVSEVFGFIFKMGSKFGALGKAVGGLLGKLAWPITIVMSIVEAVEDFMNTEGSTGDKLMAAFRGLVNGLVGWILDIPKSIISWIAGAFGFTELEKKLDSMNFKDTILKPFTEWASKLISNFFKWLGFGKKDETAPELNADKLSRKQKDLNVLDTAASAMANPELSPEYKKNVKEKLKLEYGFKDDEIDGAVLRRIVNPQKDLVTANKTGASMVAYEKDTADLRSLAPAAPALIPMPTPSVPAPVSSTVNSVTVNNTNLPDRTQLMMSPGFGY